MTPIKVRPADLTVTKREHVTGGAPCWCGAQEGAGVVRHYVGRSGNVKAWTWRNGAAST